MAKKKFLIAFKKEVHEQLKYRAAQMPFHLGDYLEQLLVSMECRLKRAYKISGLESRRDRFADQGLTFLLWESDKNDWSEDRLKKELERFGKKKKDFKFF